MTVLLRMLFLIAFLVPAGAAAQPAPGWEQAKKDVLADYKKQQPGDKVLEITGPEKQEAPHRPVIRSVDPERPVWILHHVIQGGPDGDSHRPPG